MQTKPRLLTVLDWVSIAMLLIATGMVFFYAPIERVMGLVQKVFYFHVSSAWVGMLSFLVALVAGIAYLTKKDVKWDIAGLASVEIGMVFTLIAIITGSIWARPIWNTWWTWEPRLITVTFMELIYAAYLMLRSALEDPERRARYSAVFAIVGFITVPLTFFSIRLLRTIHPVVIGSGDPGAEGGFDMTPKMLQVFMFSLLTFSIVYADLLWHRIRLGRLAGLVELLKLKHAE